MATLVLLILVGLWVAALVPPALRARAEGHPGDTIGAFDRKLQVLRSTGGYAPTLVTGMRGMSFPARARRSEMVRRRRDLLVGLLGSMAVTLLLGLMPGLRSLLVLHVALDIACAVYVGLLLHMRNLALQRVEKVRHLPRPADATVDLRELDLRELAAR